MQAGGIHDKREHDSHHRHVDGLAHGGAQVAVQQHHAKRPHRQQRPDVEHEEHTYRVLTEQRPNKRNRHKAEIKHSNADGKRAPTSISRAGSELSYQPTSSHAESD